MKRLISIISLALVTAGLVLLTDAALTLAWKEPLSAIHASLQQSEAADELADLSADFLAETPGPPPESEVEVRARAAEQADRFEEKLSRSRAIGQIRIPSIDADYVLVEGTDAESLQVGPGHYPGTALPGQGRTIGIAGHRTTYGAPFHEIDKIEPGDALIVEMPYATFTYEVDKTEIVTPDQVEIVEDVGHERLVLTACHPLYSAAERYAVFAKLVEIGLFGVGGATWTAP